MESVFINVIYNKYTSTLQNASVFQAQIGQYERRIG